MIHCKHQIRNILIRLLLLMITCKDHNYIVNISIFHCLCLNIKGCENGNFGANCRDQCSLFCLPTGTCNSLNGFCFDGCASGYFGNLCNNSKFINHMLHVFSPIFILSAFLQSHWCIHTKYMYFSSILYDK